MLGIDSLNKSIAISSIQDLKLQFSIVFQNILWPGMLLKFTMFEPQNERPL